MGIAVASGASIVKDVLSARRLSFESTWTLQGGVGGQRSAGEAKMKGSSVLGSWALDERMLSVSTSHDLKAKGRFPGVNLHESGDEHHGDWRWPDHT